MSAPPLISVIIVTYNSGDYILLALESLSRAVENIPSEILVVDNASVDNSLVRVSHYYPQVQVIQNGRNLGFAAANNIGIRRAKGAYCLLINPDTVVPEDIFTKLLDFMSKTPDAGAVGVKILNADGTFSVDSRHSVPSPLTAFWKQLGLGRLFPKNRIFGQYNLTYLDPDETYPVDAVSGSFMFIRRRVIEEVGLLDEDYFMYCEDLDYCYRINRDEWRVYYYSGSSILHFKGTSTIKSNLDFSLQFSRSLYLFYKKHFNYRFNYVIHVIVLTGVVLRAVLVYLNHKTKNLFVAFKRQLGSGRLKFKNAIFIGTLSGIDKIGISVKSAGYNLIGIIRAGQTDDKNYNGDIPVLGKVHDLDNLDFPPGLSHIIFGADQFSFRLILNLMEKLSKRKFTYNLLSTNQNYMLGNAENEGS